MTLIPNDYQKEINEAFEISKKEIDALKAENKELNEQLRLHSVGKSLPIGDVEILIKGLEHIGKWGDEEEERWDDPGDCAMDTLTQYRYSMSIL